MNICLLLVVLHSWHPSSKRGDVVFRLAKSNRQKREPVDGKGNRWVVPFDVDVTHVFTGDACLIQSDFGCFPNDGPQEVPVSNILLYFIVSCITLKYLILFRLSYFLALRGVISHGGPGKPRLLGKTSTHI